jgi:tetratricopeptide (TPR) repeat protein
MSPLLQALAAELPQWPPEKRRLLEPILIQAAEAGVSSVDELSAFLNVHPQLRSGFDGAMLGSIGPPSQLPEDETSSFSITINGREISAPEELQAELEASFERNPEYSILLNSDILEDARASGDRLREGFALGHLGIAYAQLQQMPKAIYYFKHHREIARELGNWQWEMADCDNLGHAHLEAGEIDSARAIYEEALALARKRDDREWITKHSMRLASVCARMGNMERAEELTRDAIAAPEATRR